MVSVIYEKIGDYFGDCDNPCSVPDEAECEEDIDVCGDLESGILLDCGITWVSMFDKLLMPSCIRTARERCSSSGCCRIPKNCPPNPCPKCNRRRIC